MARWDRRCRVRRWVSWPSIMPNAGSPNGQKDGMGSPKQPFLPCPCGRFPAMQARLRAARRSRQRSKWALLRRLSRPPCPAHCGNRQGRLLTQSSGSDVRHPASVCSAEELPSPKPSSIRRNDDHRKAEHTYDHVDETVGMAECVGIVVGTEHTSIHPATVLVADQDTFYGVESMGRILIRALPFCLSGGRLLDRE